MSLDAEKATKVCYRAFLENDYRRNWEDLDDRLYELSFLSDEQTVLETEVQIHKHSEGKVKCAEEHKDGVCLVPELFESVNAICELFNESGYLNEKNKYILHNYLAASFMKLIYTEASR